MPRTLAKPGKPAELLAMDWLRHQRAPDVLVMRQLPEAIDYALWGGIPMASFGWYTSRQRGFSEHRLLARDYLISVLPDLPGRFKSQGIDWFVVEKELAVPHDAELPRLASLVHSWVERGQAVVRAEFPPLQIIEVTARVTELDIHPL